MFCGIGVSTERGMSTRHNVHTRLVRDVVSRSVSPPAPRKWGLADHRTSTPEPWQPFPWLVPHPHAAEPVTLHRLDLLRSQQRIGDELVLVEDGIVEPGHVCFGRLHSLMPGSVRP